MTIGQNIRAIRKKRGLTQGRLGQLCGMTGGAISSYENGVTYQSAGWWNASPRRWTFPRTS